MHAVLLYAHYYSYETRLNDLTLTNEKLKLQLEDRDRTISRLDRMTASNDWPSAAAAAAGFRGMSRASADDIDIDRRRRERDSTNRYENDVTNKEIIRRVHHTVSTAHTKYLKLHCICLIHFSSN